MSKTLTQKGIQKVLEMQKNLILQVLGPVRQAGNDLLKMTLSDGYAYTKDLFLQITGKKEKLGLQGADFINCIIRVDEVKNIGKDGKNIFVVSDFDVINKELETKIGNPVSLAEYKTHGNTSSSNFIPKQKKELSSNSKKKKQREMKQEMRKSQESKQQATHKSKSKPKQKQKEKAKNTKPIEPLQKVSPQKPTGAVQYTVIEDLMVDQVGWTILARLTNKTEPRQFINKKGPSCIMNIELMDKNKQSIAGVLFGETATKLDETLIINQVYEVTGGTVEMAKGPGGQPSRQIQISFNQKSVFKIYKGKQLKNIPFLEDTSIKISEIITHEADQEKSWNIIGVVKEQKKMEMLKTKAGKDMAKKIIIICDPDEKLQIPITLFFKPAEFKFTSITYFFKGVYVGQYQGKKQFSMSFKSSIVPFQSFKFNNKRDLQNIDFTMGVQQSTPTRQSSCIMKILEDQKKVTQTNAVWNTIRCYINAVRTTGTNWYIGCPGCKRKVFVEQPFDCVKCVKNFPKPKYFYILNMEVIDWYSSIWVVAYDEAAKILLDGFEADEAKDLNVDEWKNVAMAIKNKEMECLVMSRGDMYEGVFRVRHTVSKINQIVYEESAKETLKKIQEYVYSE